MRCWSKLSAQRRRPPRQGSLDGHAPAPATAAAPTGDPQVLILDELTNARSAWHQLDALEVLRDQAA